LISILFYIFATPLFSNDFLKKTDISFGTEFPISIGIKTSFEFNYGLIFSATIGYMPESYVKTINSVVVYFNGYDENTASLIEDSISDSLILSFTIGYKPFKKISLYFDFGYTVALLGGDVSSSELISIVTGRDLSNYRSSDIPASSQIHNILFHIGYKFYLKHNILIDTGVGVLKTFASKTDFDIKPDIEITDQLENDINSYMDNIYTKYFISPIIYLNLGYSF
ncbi:hypothetical protein JXR93_09520, partial [bacterium]|nr:hypothetical protein [bacterium]